MNGSQTIVTQKGQVTIPAAVRRSLGIEPNDRVEIAIEGDHAVLRRVTSGVRAGYKAVRPRQRPEDFAALRDEFERGVAEDAETRGNWRNAR